MKAWGVLIAAGFGALIAVAVSRPAFTGEAWFVPDDLGQAQCGGPSIDLPSIPWPTEIRATYLLILPESGSCSERKMDVRKLADGLTAQHAVVIQGKGSTAKEWTDFCAKNQVEIADLPGQGNMVYAPGWYRKTGGRCELVTKNIHDTPEVLD